MSINNAEVRYREGFKEGARALLRGVEHFLPEPASNDAHDWLEKAVEKWLSSARDIVKEGNAPPPSSPPTFQTPKSN